MTAAWQNDLMRWMVSDDTGISSKNIARACIGEEPSDRCFHPLDISDLGRCLRLVKAVPEAREGIRKLGQRDRVWRALDAAWEEIEAAADAEGDIRHVKSDWGQGKRYPETSALLRKAQGRDDAA